MGDSKFDPGSATPTQFKVAEKKTTEFFFSVSRRTEKNNGKLKKVKYRTSALILSKETVLFLPQFFEFSIPQQEDARWKRSL
jgi:hypothetical protein